MSLTYIKISVNQSWKQRLAEGLRCQKRQELPITISELHMLILHKHFYGFRSQLHG